eukprot:s4711_g4.t1
MAHGHGKMSGKDIEAKMLVASKRRRYCDQGTLKTVLGDLHWEVAGQYDEKVLEAFQKFDADGSGSISRDELGEERGRGGGSVDRSTAKEGREIRNDHAVLKALDPEDWDNESVDELLAAADKNGDGELSVKEFLTLREHIA